MAERKGITSFLSRVSPPGAAPADAAPGPPDKPKGTKSSLFEQLNAVSALDAEPDLSRIAHNVSSFVTRAPARSPEPDEPTSLRETSPLVAAPVVTPHGQTIRSDHVVRPNGQTTRSVRSDQMVYPVRPNGQTKRSDHVDEPNGQTINLADPKPLTKTRQQKAVFGYLAANPDILTSVNNLSEILAIPPTTLRKTLTLFERSGRIRKSRIGNDGLRIVFLNPTWSDQTVRPFGQTMWSDQKDSKKDRKESSLSLSSKTFELTWPNLHRAGFGPEQIEQVLQNLAAQQKSPDRLVRSLDHAEWELERGAMTDKDGNPVADPCSWVFTALARTGYYRRPVGYVSPEEQAARDAEQDARAVTAARKQAETVRFETWRDGLSPDALAEAMVGYPGGPRDAWLRACWKRRQQAETASATEETDHADRKAD